jgi:hypothetical protein
MITLIEYFVKLDTKIIKGMSFTIVGIFAGKKSSGKDN